MPALVQETRRTVRRRVGYLAHGRDFISGVITAVSSDTFTVATAARFPTGHFVSRVAVFENGERLNIIASTQGSGLMQVFPAFVSAPLVGQTVEIWPSETDPQEVDQAIETAILEVAELNLMKASLSVATDVTGKLVTLPSNWSHFTGIMFSYGGYNHAPMRQLNSASFESDQDAYQYSVEPPYLVFDRTLPTSPVTLTGYRPPTLPVSDASLIEVRSDYVAYKAAAIITTEEIVMPQSDPEANMTKSQAFMAMAERIKGQMHTRLASNTVRINV